jgi:hypothetical protein
MPKRAGRPSVSQTPAPKSDKIYGSKKNPKGSATEKKSKSIQLSDKTINTLKEKLDNFKKSHPNKKNINLNDLKAVYRRGSGAYSSSHRPTITGGAPNSRAAWSYARVNKFLKKAGGAKVKAAYVQDDDLMANGGKVFNDKELLTKWKKGESIGFTGEAHLKAKGLIPRADGTKRKSDKYMAKGGVAKGGDCYEAAAQFCMGFMPEPVQFVGEPYLVHAEVKGQGKVEGIRFGHAWVEDDENVYDYSNARKIVMPKVVYYAIGDVQTENPLKYQRYTFSEARAKMLKTKNYGSWDIETEYKDGAEIVSIDEPVGEASQHITCINCGWEWETADSAESDKYVCHQCGFDNSLFYDGGLLKPTMTLAQIAEVNLMKDYLKPVSIEYLQEQLEKGMQHEKEHTDSDEVATSIALHHLAERPDYYEELEKMKLEDGGEVSISDEDYEFTIGGDENLGKAIKQDGVIVGGIAYDEDEQQIYGIVIKNKFRKKGVAKRAIKALFDKNPDLEGVYVRAVPESKGFWKKIGTDFSNYNEDAGLWEGYVKRFEDGGDIDLFEDMDSLPEEVQAVLRKYSSEDETYANSESMLAELEPLGYTFEYGLDALPFNLKRIDILEDNRPEDIEISDFLNQQKSEAQMVMTCDDSKIYKAMICKTKVEIADKRMSETENPEELNAWNSYKNIWNECLESILNDDMDKYKVGGKTCGCGCGSIYSKGGMFSKGGLAYGNSHDKGGMPMKVKSTGQNIEIEGGEGVVNKRSMQSSKKVEFQGQKMTPCEAVSKINQLGGGVKFKCEEVADIIAEDGNF